MKITDVRVRKIFDDAGRLKAIASATLDNAFAIHGLRVIEGKERIFVAMPDRKDKNGEYRDIVHPIDSEARMALEDAVLAAYQEALDTENQAQSA